MFEFGGYISGKAEKYYTNKSFKLVCMIIIVSFIVTSPLFVLMAKLFDNWLAIPMFLLIPVVLLPIMYLIEKFKNPKKKEGYLPYRIFSDEEYVVCVTKKNEEYRLISEVKAVYDYGEWYAIIFPLGKKSPNFICQKSLLIKGSLEEFEALFEGKIIRKKTYRSF